MANVISIINPVFVTADETTIDCVLQLDAFPEPVPFTANVNDVEEHGRNIYADLIAGVYGNVAAYVPPPPIVEVSVSAPPNVTSAPTVI